MNLNEQHDVSRRGSSKRGGRRHGGRSANTRRIAPVVKQVPWGVPGNSDTPTQPLDEDAVQAIHDGAMRVLEEIGIEFLNKEARGILAKAGCSASPDSDNVRMDRNFVMEQVRKAPSEFEITPRNPARKVSVGGNGMLFGNVASPPNCSDLDRGRRVGDLLVRSALSSLRDENLCINRARISGLNGL